MLILLDLVGGIVCFSLICRRELTRFPRANARAAAAICSHTGSTELALQPCTIANLRHIRGTRYVRDGGWLAGWPDGVASCRVYLASCMHAYCIRSVC